MNKQGIVQALMDTVQNGDFVLAKSMSAEEFQFSGPIPERMNADAWLGMYASLKVTSPAYTSRANPSIRPASEPPIPFWGLRNFSSGA